MAASVSKEEAPRAVSKVFVGVSAGMVAGVPIANFINSAVSYDMALVFLAIVNAFVLIATIIFIPSMPVKEKQSYGEQLSVPMLILTLFWGILAGGLMANVNQYLITSSASEAPFFANGLFTSACNVGTTVGSAAGGIFITQMGTQYVVLVGILSLIIGIAAVLLRDYSYRSEKQATV